MLTSLFGSIRRAKRHGETRPRLRRRAKPATWRPRLEELESRTLLSPCSSAPEARRPGFASPPGPTIDQFRVFEWYPVDGASRYRFEIFRADSGEVVYRSEPDEPLHRPGRLPGGGFGWNVTALCSEEPYESSPSNTLYFQIECEPPECDPPPPPPGPCDAPRARRPGSLDGPGPFIDQEELFEWGSVHFAIRYLFLIQEGDDAGAVVYQESVGGLAARAPRLLPGPYRWKVKAICSDDPFVGSLFSDILYFRLGEGGASPAGLAVAAQSLASNPNALSGVVKLSPANRDADRSIASVLAGLASGYTGWCATPDGVDPSPSPVPARNQGPAFDVSPVQALRIETGQCTEAHHVDAWPSSLNVLVWNDLDQWIGV